MCKKENNEFNIQNEQFDWIKKLKKIIFDAIKYKNI